MSILYRHNSSNSNYRLLWLGCGTCIFSIVIFFWSISYPQKPFGDFTKAYYLAGEVILKDPSNLYKKLGGNLTFVNLPIVALLFTPFSLFDKPIAVIVMFMLGSIANIAACILAIKLSVLKALRQYALIALFMLNGPLYYNLKIGNTTQYVLLLLLGAIFCLKQKKEVLAGSLVAIAAIIKLPFLLFGIYFAFRKQWSALIGFSVTVLTVLAASLLLFGIDLHISWYSQCIAPYLGKPLAAFNVQSIDGFLARLLTNHDLKDWTPLEVRLGFKLIKYAIISLLLGGTIWCGWKGGQPRTFRAKGSEFCIILCLSLVLSPISWTHYYSVLLIAAALWVGGQLNIPKNWVGSVITAVSFVLLSLPVLGVEANNWLVRLWVSHYFFGGLLLMGLLLAGLRSRARPELS